MLRFFVAIGICLIFCFSPAEAGSSSKEVQRLEKQLKDKDSRVRARAAWDLGQIGAVESVPALTQALSDPSEAVRANAAASLWKLGAVSKPAIPALRKTLDDSSAAAVGNAAGALKMLGVPTAELIPAYQRLLTMRDCKSRIVGVKGLINEVPPAPLFEHAWECGEAPGADSDTKREAREALRRIVSRRDRALVPQMLEALKTLGSRDGSDLTLALGSLQPPVTEAVPVLIALIDARNESTQRGAIHALGRMGAASISAVPRLVECLQSHKDADTREKAAEALGKIGPGAAAVSVPALIRSARDDRWPKVRRASLSALGEMGPAAREASPVLKESLRDPDSWISIEARNALLRVDPGSREEAATISDKSRPEQKGSLFDDLSQLQATLPRHVSEAFELVIYDQFAMVTAPSPDSRNGRGQFTYKGGTVTGPQDAIGVQDCPKKIALSIVDFSLVPKLVRQAPGLLGAPSGKVTHVTLSGGVFCRTIGWFVYIENAGFVEFRLDGKVDKIRKM
jgi:HEAT repeat protein